MLLPYVKILAIFVFMLLLMRKCGLALSVLLGSFVLSLLFGIMPLQWLQHALAIFSDVSILTVWAVVILVLSLSSLMESTGQAERFMAPLSKKILSPRIRMVFFPILIGLLPMPGGAVFSAPMINAVAKELPLPEQNKSLINYWFRHTAEMTWPLYPAMILAAGFSGFSTPELALWTSPMSLVYFALGWFFFVRRHAMPASVPIDFMQKEDGIWRQVFWQGAPLIIAIGGALVCEALFAIFLPQYPMDYGVVVAIFLAVVFCLWQNKKGPFTLFQTIAKPNVRSMVFIVGALGIFKNVLTQGGIVQQLVSHDSGLTALWMSATFLPMIIGALTGLMMAAVGSVFPLLLALVEASHVGSSIPWMMLGLTSALAGAMMSPLHICFVLSCQYFNVELPSSVKKVLAPGLLFILCGIGYFFILSFMVN